MNSKEIAAEALSRAERGQSLSNYPAIFAGFAERGIPEADIRPRENVLTFHAWKARGRHVGKGEHGVRVITWIPTAPKRDAAGKVTEEGRAICRYTTVFHISQTQESAGVRPACARIAASMAEVAP